MTEKKTSVKRKTGKKKATGSKAKKTAAAKPKTLVQEALEVTWVLKGHLKNAQIAYIRIGKMLSDVRDRKLYAELKHPDMESYAEKRLNLGRASYYRYIQVYDWISESHKEWLEPKVKGFIPDLNDATDLIWIEKELQRKDLSAQTRSELEALRAKALSGQLRKGELEKWQGRGGRANASSAKSILSRARALRRDGAELKGIPAEAITHLDAAIEIIRNAVKDQK